MRLGILAQFGEIRRLGVSAPLVGIRRFGAIGISAGLGAVANQACWCIFQIPFSISI